MTTPAKGQNMRQLYSSTSLRASEKAKIDAPLRPQNRVDTRGLSTAIFGDSFEDLSKKRADVDMWTGVSLLIIERLSVHSFWGCPWEGIVRGDHAKAHTSDCLKANLGEPFRCPRLCFLYYNYANPVFVIT